MRATAFIFKAMLIKVCGNFILHYINTLQFYFKKSIPESYINFILNP